MSGETNLKPMYYDVAEGKIKCLDGIDPAGHEVVVAELTQEESQSGEPEWRCSMTSLQICAALEAGKLVFAKLHYEPNEEQEVLMDIPLFKLVKESKGVTSITAKAYFVIDRTIYDLTVDSLGVATSKSTDLSYIAPVDAGICTMTASEIQHVVLHGFPVIVSADGYTFTEFKFMGAKEGNLRAVCQQEHDGYVREITIADDGAVTDNSHWSRFEVRFTEDGGVWTADRSYDQIIAVLGDVFVAAFAEGQGSQAWSVYRDITNSTIRFYFGDFFKLVYSSDGTISEEH